MEFLEWSGAAGKGSEEERIHHGGKWKRGFITVDVGPVDVDPGGGGGKQEKREREADIDQGKAKRGETDGQRKGQNIGGAQGG